jgi:hypothetical protein
LPASPRFDFEAMARHPTPHATRRRRPVNRARQKQDCPLQIIHSVKDEGLSRAGPVDAAGSMTDADHAAAESLDFGERMDQRGRLNPEECHHDSPQPLWDLAKMAEVGPSGCPRSRCSSTVSGFAMQSVKVTGSTFSSTDARWGRVRTFSSTYSIPTDHGWESGPSTMPSASTGDGSNALREGQWISN